MSDLDLCINQRGHVRGQITRIVNAVDNAEDELSKQFVLTNISKLNKLNERVEELNGTIASEMWQVNKSKTDLGKDLDECEAYADKIIACITTLKLTLEQLESVNVQSNNSPNNGHDSDGENLRHNKLRLPVIPMPTYSHDKDETLNQFLVSFESIVANRGFNDLEKFIYLKGQLKGEPLTLVNSLKPSDRSYETAKELLEQAFASNVTQQYDAIRRLSKLKLTKDGSAYEFVSEMRVICDLFADLNITNEIVLQYFIWHGMPSSLQTQLVNICNTNKPDLEMIKNKIFPAIDRFNELNDCVKTNGQIFYSKSEGCMENFAANIDYGKNVNRSGNKMQKPSFCSMCSSGDRRESSHATKDCHVYSSPQTKVDKLRKMGACTRCGFSNHETSKCRFKFSKPCFNCQEEHMTWLCFKQVGNVKTKYNKSHEKNINSQIVWTEFSLQSGSGSSSILPTFSFQIEDKMIRGMKDSGSQQSFITESVANYLQLKVANGDVPITVNGFNGCHTYESKIVEIPFNIGRANSVILAYCVPEIRTKLVLPGLAKVVRKFTQEGFRFADKFLSMNEDSITNIDFILGTDDFGLLLEKQCVVGTPNPSVYAESSAGILLYGDVHRWVENFASIPSGGGIAVHAAVRWPPGDSNVVERHPYIEEDEPAVRNNLIQANYSVINDEGNNEDVVEDVTNEIMQELCDDVLQYDKIIYNEDSIEVNNKVVTYVLDNSERGADGRLIMSLPWREDAASHMGNNFYLSKQILNHTLKRIQNNPVKLEMINDVFLEQENMGVIERIDNVEEYRTNHAEHSFMPHMPIFRMDKATTKCRNVFLSNLCEKGRNGQVTVNHNQALYAGPCLNQKITTALVHLRFGRNLLTYDLRKAFLQIELPEHDTHKLLFLWFRNVKKNDFSLIAYRNLRLTFGLPSSPMILMLGLFKILVLDTENDNEKLKKLKLLLYALFYMDNGAVSGSSGYLKYAYDQLSRIFAPYKFGIQQVYTNDVNLQKEIDEENEEETSDVVKVLGLNWDRTDDTFHANVLSLDPKAITKRTICRSIASQYDTFNLQGPCLNRARLFLHALQCNSKLEWDETLNPNLQKEWNLIAVQANKTPPMKVKRSFGEREDPYELIVFTDASMKIYAAVTYIKNLKTNSVQLIGSKQRLVNKQMETKTIPTLELQAITLGVEYVLDWKEELSGSKCLFPINIERVRLYTDSTISLNWLSSYCHKHDKLQNLSIFTKNRLEFIERKCRIFPIEFNFVGTNSNAADAMTRTLSPKQLMKSCYLTGPDFLRGPLEAVSPDGLSIVISAATMVCSSAAVVGW